jgi:hypothetical protein
VNQIMELSGSWNRFMRPATSDLNGNTVKNSKPIIRRKEKGRVGILCDVFASMLAVDSLFR